VQTEKGETTEISFPNSFSLATEPFILDNHFSLPSSYDHPPQESLVQHFSTSNFGRAHTQPPRTHAPHQSCEHCYHPSHQFDDYPFKNHYMTEANKSVYENAKITTKLVSEEKAVNKEEEKEEQVEQFEASPNPSNDKEVSTEAHSFVTIPLKTYHSPHVSSFQCLEEPSYVAIFEDSYTQYHKSRNRGPKRNFRSKLLGYIRWRDILLEGYLILKKKGRKGLVRHPYERGRCVIFFIYFPHFIFESFYFLFFLFVVCINLFVLLIFSVFFSIPCNRAHHYAFDRRLMLVFELTGVCSSAKAHFTHTLLHECDRTHPCAIDCMNSEPSRDPF
jgi:hypothetical protein